MTLIVRTWACGAPGIVFLPEVLALGLDLEIRERGTGAAFEIVVARPFQVAAEAAPDTALAIGLPNHLLAEELVTELYNGLSMALYGHTTAPLTWSFDLFALVAGKLAA